MNRIVREHYPVERLPEDLRPAVAAGASVRVVVETASSENCAAARERAVAEFAPVDKPMPQAQDDAAARISKVRGNKEVSSARLSRWSRFIGGARDKHTSTEDAVARIRLLRDEDT